VCNQLKLQLQNPKESLETEQKEALNGRYALMFHNQGIINRVFNQTYKLKYAIKQFVESDAICVEMML